MCKNVLLYVKIILKMQIYIRYLVELNLKLIKCSCNKCASESWLTVFLLPLQTIMMD